MATKRSKSRKKEQNEFFRVSSCLFAANFSDQINGHKKAQETQKVGGSKPFRVFSCLFAANF